MGLRNERRVARGLRGFGQCGVDGRECKQCNCTGGRRDMCVA